LFALNGDGCCGGVTERRKGENEKEEEEKKIKFSRRQWRRSNLSAREDADVLRWLKSDVSSVERIGKEKDRENSE
jgi:hypothetical protein